MQGNGCMVDFSESVTAKLNHLSGITTKKGRRLHVSPKIFDGILLLLIF